MVKFLIENGAKVDVYDHSGRSAIDYVNEETHPKIRFMIESKSRKAGQAKNSSNHARTKSF